MVNVTVYPSLCFLLSDWMCLHSWVVTGREPFKISYLLFPISPLSHSPRALHSVLLHYLGNTIIVHSAAVRTDQLLRNVNNTVCNM